jgi:hypothetical protein
MLMIRPAPAPHDHRPAQELRADEGAGEVEVDERVPPLDGHVLGRDVHAPPADVVDQDVDRAVLGERRPARALGLAAEPPPGRPVPAA